MNRLRFEMLGCLLLVAACSEEPTDAAGPGSGDSGAEGAIGSGGGGGAPPREAGAGGSVSQDAGTSDGGRDREDGGVGAVAVTVAPKTRTILTGATIAMSATVTGALDTAVAWSVVEASGCGAVTATGNYTAPSTAPDPAFCHVRATSHADAAQSDTATLTVSKGASGTPGVWEDVTPPALPLDPSGADGRCGVQDVVADPVRKSDLYAFTCYQGLWRSQDYGLTWLRVSPAGSVLENGRQWGAAIDNDPNRNSDTPPTLYTVNGYGSPHNPLRSTDWGVTWTPLGLAAEAEVEIYSYDMDPYDDQHLLVGFHESTGMAETLDGGNSWRKIQTPGSGNSIYAFFVDTGDPATTRTTWLVVPQDGTGGTTLRTADSGATWNQVGTFVHPHGSGQIFNAGNGVVYASMTGGIHRSLDSGVTWTTVANEGGTAIVGTPNFLYASNGAGHAFIQSAPREPGTTWTTMTLPAAFNQGAKRIGITHDGTHHILVQGSWMAGIWRYVEP